MTRIRTYKICTCHSTHTTQSQLTMQPTTIILTVFFAAVSAAPHSHNIIRRSARRDLSWVRNNPHGIVFILSPDFSPLESLLIQRAGSEIQQSSCIPVTVTPYNFNSQPTTHHYVYISRNAGYGCTATIGMSPGPTLAQSLNLDPLEGCPSHSPSILHEMMHSLGYDHEHNRPDRDAYVNVNYDNVQDNKHDQFNVKPHVTAVGPYDFNSILHYGRYAFARNRQSPTISSRIPGYVVPLWSPSALSPTDKKKIQLITGCNRSFF